MREKLRASRGMTLTELLVALAVVSLISLALAVGVSSAAKVYRSATRLYEAETLCGTILTCLEDEYRFARNVQEDGTFDSQTYGNGVEAYEDEGKVYIGTPTPAASDPYALNSALISAGAYTSELKVTDLKIEAHIIEESGGAGGGGSGGAGGGSGGDEDGGSKKVSVDITVGVKVGSGDDGANVEHTVKVSCLNNQ